MKQYKLTNWTVENHQSIFGAFVLRGLIQGHPTLADGTEVRTTAITSMDNEAGLAYSHHSGCFAISKETMSDDWRNQVIAGSGGADTDGSSFLQDSFEQAPFQDDTDGSSLNFLAGALGLSDIDPDADQDPGTDVQDLAGDGSNDGLDGDTSDADLGGLPPGLLALLQSLGDDSGDDTPDNALQGDNAMAE